MKDWLLTGVSLASPICLLTGCLLVADGHLMALGLATFGAASLPGSIRWLVEITRHGVHNDR